MVEQVYESKARSQFDVSRDYRKHGFLCAANSGTVAAVTLLKRGHVCVMNDHNETGISIGTC